MGSALNGLGSRSTKKQKAPKFEKNVSIEYQSDNFYLMLSEITKIIIYIS